MATDLEKNARPGTMLINMGPSHPAMHGTFRIMLELEGERILNAEVEIGYLHRGFEKTCENRTYFNLMPYTDRLNYVSPQINNLGYAMTMEKMLGVPVPERAQQIRVLMSELSRISDHLTCLAAMAMENGAFTVFLYMMKAREFLWDVIEFSTGSRMTTSYIRIGGVRADLHEGWRESVRTAVRETRRVLADVHGLLDKNQIFLNRTRGIGAMSKEDALSYGWTGPCLRSTGVRYDVRKAHPYLLYDRLVFDVPLGECGDNYDRYSVRMQEMEQSLRIIEQVAALIPESEARVTAEGLEPTEAVKLGRLQDPRRRIKLSPNLEGSEKDVYPEILTADAPVIVPAKEDTYTTMEGLISHFLFFMDGYGIRPP
ncbi:MAG TPA: NADH-quinone oxidoreductase subunit D, partial [Burkholderiales bacterium]|nr:NADH-quinone oxidoreductase subunit D [Burkholderiales bacterium]